MDKFFLKKKLVFIKNVLENIGEEYVSYEYGKPLSHIEKDIKTHNEDNLSLIKRQIKY